MNLRHLLIFKAVVDTGSFTKAAKQLYITQSGVSHAIKELEQICDTVLFDRLSKTVTLSASGKMLLEKTIPILALYHNLEKQLNNLETMAPIKVVSSITIAKFWLPKILKQFKQIYPDIIVEVQVVSAKEGFAILEKGEVDIALIEGVIPKGPFVIKEFFSYRLNILCAPSYFGGDNISLQELCEHDLLFREKGSAIRDVIDSCLYLKGLIAYPRWTSVNSKVLIEACKEGLGFTVLPRILVDKELKNNSLKIVETEEEFYNKLSLVYHKNKYLTEPMIRLISIIES